MTRLVIERLEKRFGNVAALKSLSLRVEEGELISLLGPSGCGKTTTLRCVAGFEQPDAGEILFDAQNITQLPPERRDIGMVFQNYALFPHMTVSQNLAFGLEMRKVSQANVAERVKQALRMVQLEAMLDRYPRQLSGGQQQRVALARALVIEPRMLLLDEPLANLDASLREEMRFFIRDLQQRVGITTLYVTHDQSEAMVMSDRVVVMFSGEIAQVGPPRDLYARPASREVAQFIGRTQFVSGTVLARRDAAHVELDTPLGTLVTPADPSLAVGQQRCWWSGPKRFGWKRLCRLALRRVRGRSSAPTSWVEASSMCCRLRAESRFLRTPRRARTLQPARRPRSVSMSASSGRFPHLGWHERRASRHLADRTGAGAD